MINYIDDLPLPNHLIPSKLKELLSPIDDSPLNNIEVACAYETTQSREIFCNMTTVTVPLDKINNLPLLYLNIKIFVLQNSRYVLYPKQQYAHF